MVLIRRTLDVVGLLALFAFGHASTVTYALDNDPASDHQDNTAWPTLPAVKLSLVDTFEDEASYLAKTAADLAELEQQAAQTSDQQHKVDLLLAAANQVLAFQIEPVISRQLLGLGDDVQKDDQPKSSTMLTHVRELLGASDTIIESLGQGELNDEQQAWHHQAKHRLTLLKGFAAGVEALTNAQLNQTSLRDAASRLSILREDSDGAVMSASGLWQAIVRSKMDDTDRALDVLPLALAQVRNKSLAQSFFARILRCELLAKRGEYAASLALLTNIEELSDDWFGRRAKRDVAARTASWMQLNVLKRWHQSLLEQGHHAEARWCVLRANSLIERRFSDDELTLLRLVPAVPIVAPVVDTHDKDSASRESSRE